MLNFSVQHLSPDNGLHSLMPENTALMITNPTDTLKKTKNDLVTTFTHTTDVKLF